jgi:hypothetical protein
MQNDPWFARIGFALIPITMRGFLFAVGMISTAVYLCNAGGEFLDRGDGLRATILIPLGFFVGLAYVVIGLFKSRPFRR